MDGHGLRDGRAPERKEPSEEARTALAEAVGAGENLQIVHVDQDGSPI